MRCAKGGKSTLNLNAVKPTRVFSLIEARAHWREDSAMLDDAPINSYFCVMQLSKKTIYFPLRYVNRGVNYIQPISGTVGLQNGVSGSLAFAYNFRTKELLCEFSLRAHLLFNPYILTSYQVPITVDIDPEHIQLYAF